MPRKHKSQNRVIAVFTATVALHDAQAELDEAVEKKTLTKEEMALHLMLSDSFSLPTNGHSTRKQRKEDATDNNKPNGFEFENANQAADNSLAR